MESRYGLDLFWLGLGFTSGLCGNGNEGTGCINGKEFLDEVTEIKINNIHFNLGENP
jgi:hypothetical protein